MMKEKKKNQITENYIWTYNREFKIFALLKVENYNNI